MPVALAAAPTTVVTPFTPPANYLEFLAFDPRYIYKFLKSRRCPEAVFEDFEQSLHAHLMSIGPTGKARGHNDKLEEYAPSLRGNATTVEAWADWLNLILGREYGKLIKRNNRGGVRGENVISLAVDPESTDTDFSPLLGTEDRSRLIDYSFTTLNAKVLVSSLLDYIRSEGGEMTYRFAVALKKYDNVAEVARELNLTSAQAATLRQRMREIGARFAKGC